MNKASRESLDSYYREAQSWGRDREDALKASRRIAWIVAAVSLSMSVLLVVALVVLMPLKRVEPYTILVDRQTGHVQAVDPLRPQRISGDAALTQSFLVQYVVAREGFDISTLQGQYRKVASWSAESARTSYLAAMQSSNPESPLVRLPRTSTLDVHVSSVSPVAPNVAMVRFETVQRDMGGQAESPHAYVSMIRYRYSGEPMTVEERFVNPLGFQVLRYRRDQEALPVRADDTPDATAQPPRRANRVQDTRIPPGAIP